MKTFLNVGYIFYIIEHYPLMYENVSKCKKKNVLKMLYKHFANVSISYKNFL